jgi:hypothetical protein
VTVRDTFRGTDMLDARDRRELDDIASDHARWLRLLTTGRAAAHPTFTAAPTGGSWTQGDFVRNSTPTELGTTPNKYVILGWSCIASGTPGTWVACRCLTGN